MDVFFFFFFAGGGGHHSTHGSKQANQWNIVINAADEIRAQDGGKHRGLLSGGWSGSAGSGSRSQLWAGKGPVGSILTTHLLAEGR